MPSFKDWLYGKKDKVKQRTLLTKEQEGLMSAIDQGLKKGEGPLADLFGAFNQEEFQKGVVDPTLQNYKENVLPMILEKFTAGNQSGGSGMLRGLLQGTDGLPGASQLQSELAKLMYQAQQEQKKNRLQGIAQQQGTQAFENQYIQGHPGALAEFGTEFAKSFGKKLGSGSIFGGGGGDGGTGQGTPGGGLASMAAMGG
jgi:hypothetical protein